MCRTQRYMIRVSSALHLGVWNVNRLRCLSDTAHFSFTQSNSVGISSLVTSSNRSTILKARPSTNILCLPSHKLLLLQCRWAELVLLPPSSFQDPHSAPCLLQYLKYLPPNNSSTCPQRVTATGFPLSPAFRKQSRKCTCCMENLSFQSLQIRLPTTPHEDEVHCGRHEQAEVQIALG